LDAPDEPGNSPIASDNLAPLAAMFEACLAVFALGLGWWWGCEPGATLDLEYRTWPERLEAIGWGLAASVPPLIGIWGIDRLDWRPFAGLRDLVERQVVPWFARSTVLEFAVLSLAAGFGEELLFRGLLQESFARWYGDGPAAMAVGLTAASVLFGICHALNRTYFVLATGMGAYLGLLYLWTDDLVAPILAHAVYDFVALLWLARRGGDQSA